MRCPDFRGCNVHNRVFRTAKCVLLLRYPVLIKGIHFIDYKLYLSCSIEDHRHQVQEDARLARQASEAEARAIRERRRREEEMSEREAMRLAERHRSVCSIEACTQSVCLFSPNSIEAFIYMYMYLTPSEMRTPL